MGRYAHHDSVLPTINIKPLYLKVYSREFAQVQAGQLLLASHKMQTSLRYAQSVPHQYVLGISMTHIIVQGDLAWRERVAHESTPAASKAQELKVKLEKAMVHTSFPTTHCCTSIHL